MLVLLVMNNVIYREKKEKEQEQFKYKISKQELINRKQIINKIIELYSTKGEGIGKNKSTLHLLKENLKKMLNIYLLNN